MTPAAIRRAESSRLRFMTFLGPQQREQPIVPRVPDGGIARNNGSRVAVSAELEAIGNNVGNSKSACRVGPGGIAQTETRHGRTLRQAGHSSAGHRLAAQEA